MKIYLSIRNFIQELSSHRVVRRILQYAVYLFVLYVLQTMVLTNIRPADTCAFIFPAAAVAVGMFSGILPGTVFSLAMGLVADMCFVESNILFTVLFPAISFATAFVARFFVNKSFYSFMILSLPAGLLTAFMQSVGILVTDGVSFAMLKTIILQALFTIPIAPLAFLPPARWID